MSKAAFKQELLHRANMMGMSLTLIIETLGIDGPLGWNVVFPLIAVYPGIVALTGRSLRPWSRSRDRKSQVEYRNPHHA